MHGWWSGNKKDHTRPAGGADINELKKYNAYFMGPNEKVLYLTFIISSFIFINITANLNLFTNILFTTASFKSIIFIFAT